MKTRGSSGRPFWRAICRMLFHCCCCFTLERRKVAGRGQEQMGGPGDREIECVMERDHCFALLQGDRMRHGERSLFCSISMSPPAGNYKRIETFGMNLRLCVVAVVHWRLLPLLSPLLRERTDIPPPDPIPPSPLSSFPIPPSPSFSRGARDRESSHKSPSAV